MTFLMSVPLANWFILCQLMRIRQSTFIPSLRWQISDSTSVCQCNSSRELFWSQKIINRVSVFRGQFPQNHRRSSKWKGLTWAWPWSSSSSPPWWWSRTPTTTTTTTWRKLYETATLTLSIGYQSGTNVNSKVFSPLILQ